MPESELPPHIKSPAPRRAVATAIVRVGLAICVLWTSACTTAPSIRAYQRGWQAEQEGRFADAVARYDEALALRPSLVGARVNRLRLRLLDDATVQAAREELTAARKDAPDDPDLAALALWDALRRWPGEPGAIEEARALVSRVQRERVPARPRAGLPPGPRVHTRNDSKLDPCAAPQQRARMAGVALALADGKAEEARRLLGVWPAACPAPSPLARALVAEAAGDLQTARSLLAQQMPADAARPADAADADAADAAEADRTRQLAWMRVGLAATLPDAATLSALPVHTAEQRAWRSIYLGRRALRDGAAAEALAHATDADKASPGHIHAALLRAVAWLHAGEAQRAAELLRALSARAEAASRWDLHHNLAVAELRRRRPERAAAALTTAVRLCRGACEGDERALATLRALGFARDP